MGAGVHIAQLLGVGAVTVHGGGQDGFGFILSRFHNHCTRAIAKKYGHAAAPGGKVQPHAVHFRTYQQDLFVRAGFDEVVRRTQAVDKPGTLGANIKGGNLRFSNA